MNKTSNILFTLLSIVFLYIAFNNIYPYNNISFKCKNNKLSISKILFPTINKFNYYRKTILGRLLPQENEIDSIQNKNDVDFLLMGTVIVNHKKGAIFYFKKNKQCIPFNIGDNIEGWKIQNIYRGKVQLKKNNQQIQIKITDKQVTCSKTRTTKVNTHINQNIILKEPEQQQAKPTNNLKQSQTQRIYNNQLRSLNNTNSKNKKTKIVKPKPQVSNPFLELLKKIKENQKSSNQKTIVNPFLKILKNHAK